MNVIWHQNPLWTVVELDEHDKELLWHKIKIEQLDDMVIGARMHLNEGDQFFDIAKAREELKDWESLDDRVNELHSLYVSELTGIHCGDCTCVPASCAKCHAEELVGVDTIKGLTKYMGNRISIAFDRGNRSLSEAIAHFDARSDLDPIGQAAHGWLVQYRGEHFA